MIKYRFLNIRLEHSGKSGIISINRPPDNSLTLEMMEEIRIAHSEMESDKNIRAVILTSGVEKFFSNGLDTENLFEVDTNHKIKIFESLYDLCLAVYSFPKIHISLINGHAMAAGAIIAAMSDFRFMVSGPYRFCFSEVKMGIIVPGVFLDIIRDIAKVNLSEIILQAEAYKPDNALEAGLVDNVFLPEESIIKTLKFVSDLMRAPLNAYEEAKMEIRIKNIENIKNRKDEILSGLSRFFNDDFNRALEQLNIRKRK